MDSRPSGSSPVDLATPFDLAIAGAGLNGSLLALAAGEAGLSTALIDRVPLATLAQPGFDGRTTAVAFTSQRLFAALGVWDEIAPEAEPIRDIRISDAGHDGRASRFFLHFDHREAAEDGEIAAPMGWIVENRFLRAALLRRLAACPKVELISPDEVVESERGPDRAGLVLKSGRRLATRLIASDEGRLGSMREEAGIGARNWSYNQIAIVLVAHHAEPHRGIAQERFLPSGPFAILPMTDGPAGEHRSSIVWTERSDLARRLLELDEPRFQAEFARRFGDHLGPVLWQFAPTKKFDGADFGAFLELLPKTFDGHALRHVVEVRHDSFKTSAFISLLRKFEIPVVFAEHETYPAIADITGDFVYARLQKGNDELKTCYPPKQLDAWAKRFQVWAEGGEPDDLPRADAALRTQLEAEAAARGWPASPPCCR